MIPEPKCSKRGCVHFQGVRRKGEDETTEVVYCSAFPNGIPEEIAYGNNPHTKPFIGDNGIRFEKEEGDGR